MVIDSLFHLVDGDWRETISGTEDVTDPLIVHLTLLDEAGEPLWVSWRYLGTDLRTIQLIDIGHPDDF